MAVTIPARWRWRRRTAADWTSANEVLLDAEAGLEEDTRKFKFGDGSTAWNSLPYAAGSLSQAEIEEIARDAMGTALLGTANEVTVTPNDGADTITVSLPTSLTLTGKTTTGGTISGATLSGTTTLPGGGQINSSGHVGILISPANPFHVAITKASPSNPSNGATISDTTAMNTDVGGLLIFRMKYDSGGSETTAAGIHAGKDNNTSGQFGASLRFHTRVNGGNNTLKWTMTSSPGSLIPGADNAQDLGNGSFRLRELFCANATINTSDATQKGVVARQLSPEEAAWADAIEPIAYQYNESIAAKGKDAARIHYGVVAQEVCAAGLAAGIADPFQYAFLCRDPVVELVTLARPIARPVTVEVEVEKQEIEVRDGVPVLVTKTVLESQPVVDWTPVVDETGKVIIGADVPLFDEAGQPILDEAGKPVTGEGPYHYPVPRMTEVEEEYDQIVPVLDEAGKQLERWGIRYVELLMFLHCRLRERLAAPEI